MIYELTQQNLLDPFYNTMSKVYPLVIFLLVVGIVYFVVSKLVTFIRYKNAVKKPGTTTNTWFSWDEYKKWKENL